MSTFTKYYEMARQEIIARTGAILTYFDAGTANDAWTAIVARVAEAVTAEGERQVLLRWIRHADGADLDALALEYLNVVRPEAAPANAELCLERPAPAADMVVDDSFEWSTDPTGEVVVTYKVATGVTYTMLAAETVLDIFVTATEDGAHTNVGAGALDSPIGTVSPDLPDADVTWTQADRAADGADRMSDEAFQNYLFAFMLTLGEGIVAALVRRAKSVPGVFSAAVDESRMHPWLDGTVTVRVGDTNGEATTLLVEAVADAMEHSRAAGVTVLIQGGTLENIDLDIAVRMQADATLDPGYITTLVSDAAIAAVAEIPAGDVLYPEPVRSAVFRALGETAKVQDVTVVRTDGAAWPIVPAAGYKLNLLAAGVHLSIAWAT